MKASSIYSVLLAGTLILLNCSATLAKDSTLFVSVNNNLATVQGKSCSIKDKKALEKLIAGVGNSKDILIKIKPSKKVLYTSIVAVMEAAYNSGVRKIHVLKASKGN